MLELCFKLIDKLEEAEMKKTMLLTLLLLIGFINIKAQAAEEPKGKILFKENKCVGCHAIETQGFIKKGKASAPDLSNVGNKLKAEFIYKYLKKEEKQNDEKHPISFKGSDEELTTLTEWLVTLKKAETADSTKTTTK